MEAGEGEGGALPHQDTTCQTGGPQSQPPTHPGQATDIQGEDDLHEREDGKDTEKEKNDPRPHPSPEREGDGTPTCETSPTNNPPQGTHQEWEATPPPMPTTKTPSRGADNPTKTQTWQRPQGNYPPHVGPVGGRNQNRHGTHTSHNPLWGTQPTQHSTQARGGPSPTTPAPTPGTPPATTNQRSKTQQPHNQQRSSPTNASHNTSWGTPPAQSISQGKQPPMNPMDHNGCRGKKRRTCQTPCASCHPPTRPRWESRPATLQSRYPSPPWNPRGWR